MNAAIIVAWLLVAGVVLALVRTLHAAWRTPPHARRPWWIVLLLVMQVAAAFLLYRTLLPPPRATGIETLVVATAHADGDLIGELATGERLVALPEAPALGATERMPDLAAALRAHPVRRVRIVGAGLTARDRDAARGLSLEYTPAAPPRGLLALHAPARVGTGAVFDVHGRTRGLQEGSAELLDPAGERVALQPLDGDGGFSLQAAARAPGLAMFLLRLRDAQARVVSETGVPVDVRESLPLRLLLLSGGTNAELKHLRRWAKDAGLSVHAQIELGGGMRLGDPPIAFDAETLSGFDVALLDERAWNALGDARRGALGDAVRAGLGLMLRISGPLSAAGRDDLRALGLRLETASVPGTFALPALPSLSRLPLRIVADDAGALLRDDAGVPLASWRNEGRGRIAAWLPADTYRLVLAGHEDAHAALWADALSTLARARGPHTVGVPVDGRAGERMTLCGLPEDARVVAPDGTATSLHIDPSHCAGYWPRSAGWHALQAGDASLRFHVRDQDDAPTLALQAQRETTQQLALAAAPATAAAMHPETVPGRRWPWFLAWLLLSATLWFLERHPAASPPLRSS